MSWGPLVRAQGESTGKEPINQQGAQGAPASKRGALSLLTDPWSQKRRWLSSSLGPCEPAGWLSTCHEPLGRRSSESDTAEQGCFQLALGSQGGFLAWVDTEELVPGHLQGQLEAQHSVGPQGALAHWPQESHQGHLPTDTQEIVREPGGGKRASPPPPRKQASAHLHHPEAQRGTRPSSFIGGPQSKRACLSLLTAVSRGIMANSTADK
ncbi:Hypothetical predicted protein [Marmota monax]|uniref:Uncharacterized protein n=1 Tax=Marmota monax TaxID=9995 RepID=A0A5E4BSI5_MARMO|nr:Hypothetical predicted protein [Marmota monax]